MMKRALPALAAGLLILGLAAPVRAADKAPKAPAALRCARSYAEAMAEAKDRGCIVFVTLHSDG